LSSYGSHLLDVRVTSNRRSPDHKTSGFTTLWKAARVRSPRRRGADGVLVADCGGCKNQQTIPALGSLGEITRKRLQSANPPLFPVSAPSFPDSSSKLRLYYTEWFFFFLLKTNNCRSIFKIFEKRVQIIPILTVKYTLHITFPINKARYVW